METGQRYSPIADSFASRLKWISGRPPREHVTIGIILLVFGVVAFGISPWLAWFTVASGLLLLTWHTRMQGTWRGLLYFFALLPVLHWLNNINEFLFHEDAVTGLLLARDKASPLEVGSGLIIAVAIVVADDPMWRVVSMTVISFCLLFLASASKLRPIGSILALIFGYGLDELGVAPLGEVATRGYLYVWLFVGIPVGVSIVVNLLIAPPPRRLAERAIARRLMLAAAMLRGPVADSRRLFNECLQEGSAQIQSWIDLAQRERSSHANDLAALRQAADSTLVLLSAIDVADRCRDVLLPSLLREYLAKTLEEMAQILLAGGYPVDIGWQPPGKEPLLVPLAEQVLAEIRDAIGKLRRGPILHPARQPGG